MLIGIEDEDKAKNFGIIGGGCIMSDVGDSYVDKRGYPWQKVTNGVNFRYKMVSGTRLVPNIVNATVQDTTTSNQTMFTITIPGGALHEGDSITLTYNLGGNFSSYAHELYVGSYPIIGTNVGGYWSKTAASGGSYSYTITARDSNVLIMSSGTQYNYKIGNTTGAWPCNLLNDVTLTILTRFSGASSGRKQTVSNINCIITTSNMTTVADQSQYRLPHIYPFRPESPWNVPLDTTAVYGDMSNPMGIQLRDIWTGLKVKGNVGNRTNIRWIGRGTGTSGSSLPIYQIQKTDPIQEVSPGTLRGFAAYPFAKLVNGRMKMRLPVGPLITGQSSDRVVILITEDKRFLIELGQYSYNTTTKLHGWSHFYIHDLYGYGISPRWYPFFSTTQITSQLAPTTFGFQHGYRAAGTPLFAGMIRTEELNAGEINHMIGIQLDNFLLRTNAVAWVSSDAVNQQITIKPRSASVTEMDYSYLFSSGTKVVLGSQTMTCNGFTSYNSTLNTTTFGVNEPITGTGSTVYLGGDATARFEYKYQWPAAECDSGADNTTDGYLGLIPLGQVFAIPPSVDLATIGLKTPEGLALARAYQKFGACVVDVTGSTFMVGQCDQNATGAQINALMSDVDAIVTNLVPVLNYGRSLVQASLNNNSIVKPKPLLPLYS